MLNKLIFGFAKNIHNGSNYINHARVVARGKASLKFSVQKNMCHSMLIENTEMPKYWEIT